jgi:hypothetical protein
MQLVPSLPPLKVKSFINSEYKGNELENVITIDESTLGKMVFRPPKHVHHRNISGTNKSCFIKES